MNTVHADRDDIHTDSNGALFTQPHLTMLPQQHVQLPVRPPEYLEEATMPYGLSSYCYGW
jgi:hypothetical protein